MEGMIDSTGASYCLTTRRRDGRWRFIGKLLGEARASRAMRRAQSASNSISNEFETVWSGAAETFDGKSKPLVGLIGDGQNAAREVVLF